MAGLEIQIGADKTDFNKKVKEVEFDIKELSKLKLERIKLGLDTKELDKNIIDAKKSLSSLKTSLKDTGTSIGKDFAPKVANGGNALLQFSRIAQDAPFGIMGIGNNITATAESFGHLVKETGSAGGALKSVASSMLGTGGILLAVSLVTSGLTYMSQNGITVKDVFDKLSGTFDEFGKSIKTANAEAAKSASGQISSFKAYADAAQDSNLPLEHRLIAVKKLRDIAPYYLKDLTDEKILYGDLSGVIENVTASLLAQARAKAYSSLLDETTLKQVKLFTEVQDDLNKAVQDFKIPGSQILEFQKAIKSGTGALMRYLTSVKKAPITPSDFIDFSGLENLSEKYKDLGKLNAEAYRLGLKVNSETKKQLPLDYTDPPKGAKTYSTPQVIGVKSELDSAGLAETAGIIMQIAKNVQGAEGMISTSMGNINAAVDTNLIDLLEKMYKFNEQLSSIITNGTVNALSGIGEAIGDALVNGGNIIDSVGKTILGSMGSMLKDLGKATIAYGVGLIAVKAAIKNPYLAVAAGVAMVALGSAMSSAVSKSSSSALGGSSSGGMSSGASYSSPASSSSYSSGGGGMGGGTVVFEISGTSLIGVLNNTLDRNKRLGGA